MSKEEYARLREENIRQPQGSNLPPTGVYTGYHYNTMTPPGAPVIPAPQQNQSYIPDPRYRISLQRKSLLEAYLLWLILGLLGAHHFYLRRPVFGILYFFTFGLCGFGWLIDMFRMAYLVRRTNKEIELPTAGDKRKTISDAYTLWFPFGLLGFHHFYLNNIGLGCLYFFTFGLAGIGWLVDLFRIPSMVRKANTPSTGPQQKSLCTAYLLGLSPVGIFGAHHFYLNRPAMGIHYFLTLGNFGLGWISDWFRMSCLVKRANKDISYGPDYQRHLDDAYLYWFPLGLLGIHHFYLLRPAWGFIYFFTFGLCGIGWLIDACRLPCLVRGCNKMINARRSIPTTFGVSPEGIGYPILPNQGQQIPYNGYRPPTYGPAQGPSCGQASNQRPQQQYTQQQQYQGMPTTNLGQPPPYTP